MVGIILLIGIVKKNAIMMIDFSLETERRGGSRARSRSSRRRRATCRRRSRDSSRREMRGDFVPAARRWHEFSCIP
jgi:hypothetical protein